jgi:CRP-like cAMP-binding protein
MWDEGSDPDSFFVIVAGEMEVSRTIAGRCCVLGIAGPGHMLAFMAAIDGGLCPLAIRALTESTLVEIDRTTLLALLASDQEPHLAIARKLALLAIRRLRSATDDLARALHFALATPGRGGRIDPRQMARIQMANHLWALA